jgi:hypothetical protein
VDVRRDKVALFSGKTPPRRRSNRNLTGWDGSLGESLEPTNRDGVQGRRGEAAAMDGDARKLPGHGQIRRRPSEATARDLGRHLFASLRNPKCQSRQAPERPGRDDEQFAQEDGAPIRSARPNRRMSGSRRRPRTSARPRKWGTALTFRRGKNTAPRGSSSTSRARLSSAQWTRIASYRFAGRRGRGPRAGRLRYGRPPR